MSVRLMFSFLHQAYKELALVERPEFPQKKYDSDPDEKKSRKNFPNYKAWQKTRDLEETLLTGSFFFILPLTHIQVLIRTNEKNVILKKKIN